jgi:hypothetical protein
MASNRHSKQMGPAGTVQNAERWGRNTAVERYGKLDHRDGTVWPDSSPQKPQKLGDKSNLQDAGYDNDVKNNWLRGAGSRGVESAQGKPDFDRMRHIPKPVTERTGEGFYRAGEVPDRFHAEDANGRMGAGRGRRPDQDPASGAMTGTRGRFKQR